ASQESGAGPSKRPGATAAPYPSPAMGPSGTASEASGRAAEVSTTTRNRSASAYARSPGSCPEFEGERAYDSRRSAGEHERRKQRDRYKIRKRRDERYAAEHGPTERHCL